MVELPRYVHRVTKARKGREPIVYTFYTRHRNTPEAWPSIALPEPLSIEFPPSVAICGQLERKGGAFHLHGIELPHHSSKDFWPAAHSVAKAKARRDHHGAKDFTGLVEAFQESPVWAGLSKSTQKGYRQAADLITSAWGFDMPDDLTTVDAQQAIDGLAETPSTANGFRAFASRLYSWGIPRGYATSNPFAASEKIPGGEPWQPWPEWAFVTLVENAPFNMLLPAISALFTGQRQTDVLKMLRPKSTDKTMEVRAQKTKNTVWIPIHSAYRTWIEKGRADAVHMHLGVRGAPYKTADGFRAEWQRMMDTKPFERFRAERIVFHGLRKNAVINLLEVGCTEAQVGSIVNMSEQMVRHYGQEVSSRALARDGMKLLESRWAEVQPAILEREQNTNWKPAVRIGNRWQRSERDN
jgi:integrase